MGGGYAPIGALLISRDVFRSIAEGSGAFAHSHTFMGHPLACTAALAVQQIIRRDDLVAHVRRQGAHLTRRLGERFGNHPFVGNVRGRRLRDRAPERSSQFVMLNFWVLSPCLDGTFYGGTQRNTRRYPL